MVKFVLEPLALLNELERRPLNASPPVVPVIPGRGTPPAGRVDAVRDGTEDGVMVREGPDDGDMVPPEARAAKTSCVGFRAFALESDEEEPSLGAGAGLLDDGADEFHRSENESDMMSYTWIF
jgi:hypothetical protein